MEERSKELDMEMGYKVSMEELYWTVQSEYGEEELDCTVQSEYVGIGLDCTK